MKWYQAKVWLVTPERSPCRTGGSRSGPMPSRQDSGPVPYIRPGDFDATLEAIKRAGGEVLIPKTDVKGYGWFAHFRDPEGNVIGLWQDAAHPGEAASTS